MALICTFASVTFFFIIVLGLIQQDPQSGHPPARKQRAYDFYMLFAMLLERTSLQTYVNTYIAFTFLYPNNASGLGTRWVADSGRMLLVILGGSFQAFYENILKTTYVSILYESYNKYHLTCAKTSLL